jgi:hypothetical protein
MNRRLAGLFAGYVLLADATGTVAGGAAQTAPSHTARVKAFARLPDWSGIWLNSVWLADASGRPPGGPAAVRANAQMRKEPPYNEVWAAKYRAVNQDTAGIAAKAAALTSCLRGYPGLMEGPMHFQIAALPGETLIVFESGQVRHIYTDGRSHPGPDDLWPTPLGDSIGHWEGDTLVIDTIERISSDVVAPAAWGALLSDQARFTERWRMVDPDTLENQMTIDDPVTLAKPWVMRLQYKRQRVMDRMLPFDCTENERNPVVDGKLIVAPPQEIKK